MSSSLQPDGRAEAVNPWLIALTVMLATFMEVLDTSIANVALPHIAGNLSAGVDESTWVLTSYLVSNAIVLPLTGWFSTLLGRKRFYMGCVVIFTVSSFLCGLAPNLPLLIVFRILQGAGGGGLQPVSQAILVESFDKRRQGMAMAVYGMGVVVAPIVGPTLGGWITDNYTWRWIFFINIPVGILSLVLTSLLIADPPYLLRRGLKDGLKIDYIGLGLLSVGLGFLQVMLDKGQRDDWFGSTFIVWCAVLALCGLAGAVIWELRQKDPIIDLHLLRDRNFAGATVTMYMLGFALYGSTVLLPILLQTLMGYTAELSGLVLSPGALATLFILPVVGKLLVKHDARWLVVVGLLILGFGTIIFSRIDLNISFSKIVGLWTVSRTGLAFLFVPINVMAFSYISKQKTNNATGLINLARNIGGSAGISFVTTMLDRRAQTHQQILTGHLTPLDPGYQAAVHGLTGTLMQHGSGPTEAAQQAQGLLYGLLQQQSAMLAFIDNFWLLGVICLAMIPLIFFMKKAKSTHAPVAAH
ncbi:MAG TPA: DHA2 family efflux MFS transporter permease subunit [Terriglobia bacterium]|nr:DHA2 family efflux MFS transporter permease subunit [Terriglobia bacterium]